MSLPGFLMYKCSNLLLLWSNTCCFTNAVEKESGSLHMIGIFSSGSRAEKVCQGFYSFLPAFHLGKQESELQCSKMPQ